jgi:hypothetical protein
MGVEVYVEEGIGVFVGVQVEVGGGVFVGVQVRKIVAVCEGVRDGVIGVFVKLERGVQVREGVTDTGMVRLGGIVEEAVGREASSSEMRTSRNPVQ